LQGLQSYPNPGKLLSQVWPSIKLAIPKIELTGLDYDYLNSLAGNQIATGTAQEIIEVLA
jgi:ABC-type enterochelin transport system ATPase subunit